MFKPTCERDLTIGGSAALINYLTFARNSFQFHTGEIKSPERAIVKATLNRIIDVSSPLLLNFACHHKAAVRILEGTFTV